MSATLASRVPLEGGGSSDLSTLSNELRVLVVLTGREGGGVRSHVLNDLRHASAGSLRFTFACLQDGPMCAALRREGAHPTVLRGDVPRDYRGPLRAALRVVSSVGQLRRVYRRIHSELETRRPDVVYAHNPYLQVVCGLAARRVGIGAVGCQHFMMNRRRAWGLQRRAVCAALGACLDALVAISVSTRSELVGRAARIAHVVYNGVDVAALGAEAARQTRQPEHIVMLGRLSPNKKYDVALRALRLLSDAGVHATLEIVGGPLDESNAYACELRRLIAALNLSDQVQLVGWQSPPYARLARAEALVNCSTVEGFGYVVVEAMACGTPVIVADRGSPAEIVRHKDTGLHFPADEPAGLAVALREVLTDAELRTRLSQRAHADVLERFDQRSRMRRLHEVLATCAAARRGMRERRR